MTGNLLKRALQFDNCWREYEESCTDKHFSVSVIIPSYYPEHLEEVVCHLRKIGGYGEIIIVDDTGTIPESNYRFTEKYDNIRVICHDRNFGRSAARNTGASFARGDILLFIDQDMFLDTCFFSALDNAFFENESLLFMGCRETAAYEKIPSYEEWVPGDLSLEWRIKTTVLPDLVDLTALGVGNAENCCRPYEDLRISDATEKLKKIGVAKEKTIGFWDLPSMVISHSLAIAKEDFYRIGGFPEWIRGWGGEDIVLGFLACAAGIPIHLSKCCSYQAYHKPYSGNEQLKWDELKKNICRYREWAGYCDHFPKFDQSENMLRGRVIN